MPRTVVLALAMMMAVVALRADEKPTPEFQNIMKSNAAANADLRKAIPAKDYTAVARGAATVEANYAKIEAFWTARKVEDAIAFAKAGSKAATDLEAAAKAQNDAGIEAANKALGATCAGCHAAHRVQLPDKTYEIK